MKTVFLSLITLCLLAPAQASTTPIADLPCCMTASDRNKKSAAPERDAPDLSLDILFQEEVYIHIEDAEGNTTLSGAYSREALQQDMGLRQLLRKSRHYLRLENHYYYRLAE
ncbi:hypothetical protein [Cesiribacter andamanensis]|uniref:Uncharacterized protein n=1 Tax=Cesiribacter andamanensis AMV16 TaxID=1279009 RepID=M7NTP3_9BACT|nr:hypothetical protein [Cesiribacter andamanensis]EMR01829.1 hypothetical protein ADICEAN_03025 [Cesiribacter andamanensis AMV16]